MKKRGPIALICAASAFVSMVSAQAIGPDDFGYIANPVASNFFDISGIGTDVTGLLPDLDDSGVFLPLGFSFDLYGTTRAAG